MRKVGTVPRTLLSRSTCAWRGRLLGFSWEDGWLVVTEVLLGDGVAFASVSLDPGLAGPGDGWIGSCPLGPGLLVLAAGRGAPRALLVELEDGPLRPGGVSLTPLEVGGDPREYGWPYLCHLGGDRALLQFNMQPGLWSCRLRGRALELRPLEAQTPQSGGFATVPLRLPDGRLLAAGSWPDSRDVTAVSLDGGPAFERLGDIPGPARDSTSLILLADRFALNAGGWNGSYMDDLWVFDLERRRGSPVRKGRRWIHPNDWVVLAVRGGALYVIGGEDCNAVYAIPLRKLAARVEDGALRLALLRALGLPLAPRPAARGPGWLLGPTVL